MSKSSKINSLKVYQVLNLSISLLMLIVPTFFSFSSYCLRAKIVESTIFHRTYSHEIYYGYFTIKQEIQFWKFSKHEDFCRKANGYPENLKQNIWIKVFPVSVLSEPKDSQNLFEVLSELQTLNKFQILN